MVVHYLNQKYAQLRRQHQRSGEAFTDPEFPPSNSSLFLSGHSEQEIVWKRPAVSESLSEKTVRGKGGFFAVALVFHCGYYFL